MFTAAATMMLSSLLQFNMPSHFGNPYRETIRVRTQEAFDTLGTSIRDAAERGMKKINVKISKGTYYFGESHLRLENIDSPELQIIIEAGNSTFVPKGATYFPVSGSSEYEDDFAENVAFADTKELMQVEPRTEVRQALSGPAKADGMYRIRAQEADLPDSLCKDTYLILSQWYASGVHKVEKIENSWIYFSSTYSFDQITRDAYYGGKNPKYILVNSPSPDRPSIHAGRIFYSGDEIHQGDATRFLMLGGCNIKSFSLSKARFLGNKGNGGLLYFAKNTVGAVTVSDCSFTGLHGRAVVCESTPNLTFRNNEVTRCFLDCVTVDGPSANAVIEGNTFHDNGQRMTQSFDVVMRGSDFLVRDNVFSDFCYAGLGIGYHYRTDGGVVTSGVVEGNEFFQSEEFRSRPVTRTLMDSGAIYIWTINKDVVIRGNYIHDITGAKDNRGIFGDDGAFNVTVCNNLILGIENSYTIDFRRVSSVEGGEGSRVDTANINLRMYGNMVDGRVRFQPRPGDERSYKGDNILVSPREDRDTVVRKWKRGKAPKNSQSGVGEDL